MAIPERAVNNVAIGSWSTSDQATSGFQLREEIKVIHELGSDLMGGTIKKSRLIDTSKTPTLVTFESQVVTEAARCMNSPEYLSSVRRRTSGKIKNMLDSLARKAHRDDFEAFTFRVVEEVRELLHQLKDVRSEGNTREILRQVRDTFMDGGHERYRDPKARALVAEIFKRLAEADEVTPEDVDQVWDDLYDSGLAPPMPALFVIEEERDETDG